MYKEFFSKAYNLVKFKQIVAEEEKNHVPDIYTIPCEIPYFSQRIAIVRTLQRIGYWSFLPSLIHVTEWPILAET